MIRAVIIALTIFFLTSARPDESLVTGLKSAGQSGIDWAENAAKDVGSFFRGLSMDVGETAEQAWNATQEKAGALGETVKEAAGNAAEHGEHFVENAKNWTIGAIETVKRDGSNAANAAGDAFKEVGQKVEHGAQEGIKTVEEAAKEDGEEKSVFAKVGDWFRNLGK